MSGNNWTAVGGFTLATLWLGQTPVCAQRVITPWKAVEMERARQDSIRAEGRGGVGLNRQERELVAICVAKLRRVEQAKSMADSDRNQSMSPDWLPAGSGPAPFRSLAPKGSGALGVGMAAPAWKSSQGPLPAPVAESLERTNGGMGMESSGQPVSAAVPAFHQRPTAEPVPGKPGIVISPFAPEQGYVDVRGLMRGTAVRDPYSGQLFIVP